MSWSARVAIALFGLLGLLSAHSAHALNPVDFEGLPDGTPLTTQVAGATFSNAVVLSSGISLNEFEFPPHSGVSVASDNGGTMQIVFNTAVVELSAFFTYAVPLTLTGFDAGGQSVAVAASLFSSNLALSGDVGSSANERISLAAAAGISRLVIAGDAFGASFVIDDLAATAVPEPATYALMFGGLWLVAAAARARGTQEAKP